MQKHLFWYPWVIAALAIGILVCIGLIVRMLFFQPQQAAFHPGAHLVKEVCRHALA